PHRPEGVVADLNLDTCRILIPCRAYRADSSANISGSDVLVHLHWSVPHRDLELRPHNVPLAKIVARCRNVGNIDLILPARAGFELEASTEKGEVRNDYGGPVKMDTEGRTQTMRSSAGGGPSIQVSTARGTVTVRKE